MTKTCTKCGEVKPLSDYPFKADHRDKRASACKVCKQAQVKAWNQRNRERRNAQARGYRQTDPLRVRALAAERVRRYKQRHPGKKLEHDARRRGYLSSVPSDLTAEQWEAIKAAYSYRCAYCGHRPEVLTKDHVVPVSRGGAHTASNIVPACQSCNSRKNARTADEFQGTSQRL